METTYTWDVYYDNGDFVGAVYQHKPGAHPAKAQNQFAVVYRVVEQEAIEDIKLLCDALNQHASRPSE